MEGGMVEAQTGLTLMQGGLEMVRPDCDNGFRMEAGGGVAMQGGEGLEIDDDCWDSDDECFPRIGEEYQVEIPQMPTRNFMGLQFLDDSEEAFLTGIPVRITSMHMLNDRKQENLATSAAEQGLEEALEAGGGSDSIEENESRNGAEHPKTMKQQRKGKKKKKGGWSNMRRLRAKNSCELVIVPGDSFEDWNDVEVSAFILGLYLFGKNFIDLRQFVETRASTDVQHYYYSRFYGSVAYKRWVAARNNSRRIVNGEQILVGWRQEEFLRRLLPEVDESSRTELFEAIANFNKGEISFHSLVHRVKAIVGIELFVDAVGLGCGKRDLTMGSVDSVQNNSKKKWELPVGKAFSDFTASEMSRALSGGHRLSKTRAQELFWEAIWPRLLAKGWSSEQSGSKGPLVYMVPGIKRYSRRSLVKGRDYFDSISEVLNHLSGDPGLLELPELDNELLAKSQAPSRVEQNEMAKKTGDRKQRPTLWLSKGTSHATKVAGAAEPLQESNKASLFAAATSPTQDRGAPSSGTELKKSEASSISGANHNHQHQISPVSGTNSSSSSSRSSRGSEALTTRKRGFYEAFPGSGADGGVRMSLGNAWLNNVIKQYLGNGKSVRLYGPVIASTKLSFLRLESGGEPRAGLSLNLHRKQQLPSLENSVATLTTAAVATLNYCCRLEVVESPVRVEELPGEEESLEAVGGSHSAAMSSQDLGLMSTATTTTMAPITAVKCSFTSRCSLHAAARDCSSKCARRS